jgi:hypothetical protein
VKITKEKGIKMCSLVCSTLREKKRVGTLGWELRRVTSGSTIHMGLHKPNNKFVNA